MRSTLYQRIRQILESARLGVARTVNTTQVCANWLIGREIVEQEQRGKRRAGYGEQLIASLSAQITREFGSGYSVNNLEHFRNFYITYPNLVRTPISHAPRGELLITEKSDHSGSAPSPKRAAIPQKLFSLANNRGKGLCILATHYE